ncbi:MAG TPA: hypothetical protein VK803_11785 [Steroidobacteraceae bacterium]|nr:hypothetical protein [Steroidobacteraceae bacterium]
MHKDFLTSCETLIAGRVIHKLDRDAIKDWIDGCADPELGKQVLKELAGMKRTEAWVWSPEIEFGPERVTFPMFTTYDSFKPQGGEVKQLKGWAAVDLEDVKTKLAGVVAEAEANDPRKLRARIAELERQAKASPAPGASREDLQAAEQRGFAAGEQHAWREVEGRFKDLHAAVRETIEMTLRPPPAAAAAERSRKDPGSYPVKTPVSAGVKPSSARITKPLKRLSYDGNGAGEELTPGQRKVLAALLQYPAGLTREQLTVLAGYKRSTRDLYLQQLTRAGLVEYGNGKLIATFAGAAALPDAAPLPTGQELREHWLTKLPPGERKVLEVLIESYPQALDRAALGERAGYQHSTRDLYVQRLQRRQLVTTARGQVAASETLF